MRAWVKVLSRAGDVPSHTSGSQRTPAQREAAAAVAQEATTAVHAATVHTYACTAAGRVRLTWRFKFTTAERLGARGSAIAAVCTGTHARAPVAVTERKVATSLVYIGCADRWCLPCFWPPGIGALSLDAVLPPPAPHQRARRPKRCLRATNIPINCS